VPFSFSLMTNPSNALKTTLGEPVGGGEAFDFGLPAG